MSLKTWLVARKERRQIQQQKNGYDWAAGDLLRGVPPAVIESSLNCPFDEDRSFDQGARNALIDWGRLNEKKQVDSMYVTQEMIDNFLRTTAQSTETHL